MQRSIKEINDMHSSAVRARNEMKDLVASNSTGYDCKSDVIDALNAYIDFLDQIMETTMVEWPPAGGEKP